MSDGGPCSVTASRATSLPKEAAHQRGKPGLTPNLCACNSRDTCIASIVHHQSKKVKHDMGWRRTRPRTTSGFIGTSTRRLGQGQHIMTLAMCFLRVRARVCVCVCVCGFVLQLAVSRSVATDGLWVRDAGMYVGNAACVARAGGSSGQRTPSTAQFLGSQPSALGIEGSCRW